MLRKLSILLVCLLGLSVTISAIATWVRGPEYTIEELYNERLASNPLRPPIALTPLVPWDDGERTGVESFVALLHNDPDQYEPALIKVRSNFHLGDTIMLVEALPFLRGALRKAVIETIDEATGERFKDDQEGRFKWVWEDNSELHPRYSYFKSRVYEILDVSFGTYFQEGFPSSIALSEVRWGGVGQDGIPPLRKPQTSSANEAVFLADSDVVFGVEINGESRAYPKRILAWHEMVNDIVGGESVSGVYCTLCGSMIVYRTKHDGTHHELGTSGFLYRSNKLMYDRRTQSLWSTLTGTPVIGRLAEQGIRLEMLPVVTTTWQQWRQLHPETQVLTLNTGHRRDYGEGMAYKEYLSTDQLMFTVPTIDTRLKNKDEVLAIDRRWLDTTEPPLALSMGFLADHPIHHVEYGGVKLVILTDKSGASRVYRSGIVEFERWDTVGTAVASDGREWSVKEDRLALLNQEGAATRSQSDGDPANASAGANPITSLDRVPAHRAFWFGWHAAHPDTQLVL